METKYMLNSLRDPRLLWELAPEVEVVEVVEVSEAEVVIEVAAEEGVVEETETVVVVAVDLATGLAGRLTRCY